VDWPAFPFAHQLSVTMEPADDRLTVTTSVTPTGSRFGRLAPVPHVAAFRLDQERTLALRSANGSIELRCGNGYDFAQVWVAG
jgi:hypothetical protein